MQNLLPSTNLMCALGDDPTPIKVHLTEGIGMSLTRAQAQSLAADLVMLLSMLEARDASLKHAATQPKPVIRG